MLLFASPLFGRFPGTGLSSPQHQAQALSLMAHWFHGSTTEETKMRRDEGSWVPSPWSDPLHSSDGNMEHLPDEQSDDLIGY